MIQSSPTTQSNQNQALSFKPVVFVVDDDASVRESLEMLILCQSWHPQTFSSARAFLAHPRVTVPHCLLLDIALPDTSGLNLQKRIALERTDMPIIFITGKVDVPTSVQAMKAGAFEFLLKPLRETVLLPAIRQALDRSRIVINQQTEMRALLGSYASLTPREREVMALVSSGLLNKQVGWELGISEITVKAHRGKMMQKMKADSLAALVRMAAKLSVNPMWSEPPAGGHAQAFALCS